MQQAAKSSPGGSAWLKVVGSSIHKMQGKGRLEEGATHRKTRNAKSLGSRNAHSDKLQRNARK